LTLGVLHAFIREWLASNHLRSFYFKLILSGCKGITSVTQSRLDGRHVEAPNNCLCKLCSASVTAKVALPHCRAETTIGSHADFEVTNKIWIHFLSDNTIL